MRPELMRIVKQFRAGLLNPQEAVEVAQKYQSPTEEELEKLKELVGWQQGMST